MRKIQFSEFELDLELFVLRRDGIRVDIGARALDLLIHLIENRQRVVELAELREKVWQAAALSPSSIPTCVRDLRIALQDDANDPKLIETARGRGYRFIGKVAGLWIDEERDRPLAINLPFVGRETELQAIETCLQATIAEARCHLFLIRGEAGIGKTRLVAEFIAQVRSDVSCFIAKCPGFGETPGFWPWTQMLREALADQGDANQELSEHAHALSTVFPEIQDKPSVLTARPINLHRFSILSQWARTIRSVSAQRPLLLAFEDIHRADIDTLTLLSWICEELSNDPVFIIASRRPRAASDRVASSLNDLSAIPTSTSLDLGPLTASQIAAMMDPLIDNRETLGQALRYRTDGNPFYVTSLIRILGQRSIAESTESIVAELPPNAEEIVSHQLADLPESTRRALIAGAVSDEKIHVSIVANALDLTDEELISHLEPARRAWVIADEGSDYTFVHSLLRDALYHTLDSTERRRLHLAIAHSIRDLAPELSMNPQIAGHLLKAIPFGDPSVALFYVFEAGAEASARFAYSKAQAFFKSALELAETNPDVSISERVKIMLALSEAQLYEGDREAASSTLLEAALLARAEGDAALLASCALQMAPDFLEIEVGSYDTILISLLREVLESLPRHLMSLHSQILSRLSHALLWSPHTEEAEQLSIDALAIARKCRDNTSLSAALSARADSLHGPDRLNERMAVTMELKNSVRAKKSIPDTMMQHVRLVSTYLEIGDVRELDAAIQSCEDIANEMNVPQYLWYPKAFRAMRKLMSGDFASALALGEQFRNLGECSGDANVRNSFACQTGCILIEMNQAETALPTISRMASKSPLVRAWTAGRGYLQLLSGDRKGARRILESFGEREIQRLFRESGGNAGIALLAHLAAEIENSTHRSVLYDLCCRAPTTSATLGFGITYFGCFHRYAGMLASSLGLTSEAVEHLRKSIGIESMRGAVVCRSHSDLDLAQVLVDSGGSEEDVASLFHSVEETLDTVCSTRLQKRLSETRQLLLPK